MIVACPRCGRERQLIRNSKKLCKSCVKLRKTHSSLSQVPGYELKFPNGTIGIRQENGTVKGKHRVVMEQVLGRSLKRNEFVGFKDNDPSNCDPNNLSLKTKCNTETPSAQNVSVKTPI